MKKRNRIISILMCIPVMLSALSFNVLASALPAFAIPADTTIADVVLGMLTGTGSLPINADWLASLDSAFGSTLGTIEDFVSSGLITESGGSFFDSGLGAVIESMPEYTSLGLDSLFSVGAEEAASAGVTAISGGAFLSGQTLLGMEVGAMGIGAGVLGGVGLGILAAHVISTWGKPMSVGAPIDSNQYILDNMYTGGLLKRYENSNGTIDAISFPNDNWICGCYPVGNNRYYVEAEYIVSGNSYYKYIYHDNSTIGIGNIRSWGNFSYNNYHDGFTVFNTEAEWDRFVDAVKNGTEEKPGVVSPDVIGPDGKTPSHYDPEQQKYVFPTIQPQFNPSAEGIKPIPYEVIQPLPSIIDNPSADPDAAKDAYKDLIDEYVVPITPPETEPGGDPEPGQNPYLDPDAIPEQPEFEPKQSEISETEIGEAGPYTTPNLMERFPFCIPNDILSIFSKFKSARQAPSISWRFYVEDFGIDYTFNLDLSDFDEVAELLRLLELVLFVVGIAVATRYLIGG